MLLIDSTVWIDWLRNYPPAIAYVHTLDHEAYTSVLVLAELTAGARKDKQAEVIKRLSELYGCKDVNLEIANLGGEFCMRYGPSHGTGSIDALLAATAKIHGLTLVTHNRKHFPILENVIVPY